MSMNHISLYSLLTCLDRHVGAKGIRGQIDFGLIELSTKHIQHWPDYTFKGIMAFLKVELRLGQLTDLFATHYPYKPKNEQMEITYVFLSLFFNVRILLRANITPNLTVQSLSNMFKSANWLERETYEMFGIIFAEHPDLRPLLTDYGFQGNPLRKDFPLTGYVQIRYDYEMKSIVSEPLKLTQEFRNFDFVSPWKAQTKNSRD
jgi:NADH-quinone oxidoreductase subunit C